MISIEVRYKLIGASQWQRRQMTPSEYFWVDPGCPNDMWEVDSITKHNHFEELLAIAEADQLEQGITCVTNSNGDYFECVYHFWGGSENYVCLVTRHLKMTTARELIFFGSVPFKENGSQVVRVALENSSPRLTMNCFMWGPGGDYRSLDMVRQKDWERGSNR